MYEKKINILYVVSTLRNSGPTNQLLGIIKNLNHEEFTATILTLSPEPENSKINDFRKNNIIVESLNLSRKNYLLNGKKKLHDYLEIKKPDIIHTSGIRADVDVSKIKFNAYHVMTIRNYVYDDYVSKFGKIVGYIASYSAIKAMENCNNVVYCSYSLKEMYKKHIQKEVLVIQNGVDVEKYNAEKNSDEIIKKRQKLGIPINKKIFLMVGSLIPRKDPLTVIEAFKKANTNNIAQLYILGSGELLEKIKITADENIIVLGNVDNTDEYYKVSDVFVTASKSEGLPNTVLEAASSGLELILSDIPQHKEIFNDRLDLINMFQVEDVNDLSIKMMEIQKSTRNIEIIDYVQNNFSTKRTSFLYQDLYKNIYML